MIGEQHHIHAIHETVFVELSEEIVHHGVHVNQSRIHLKNGLSLFESARPRPVPVPISIPRKRPILMSHLVGIRSMNMCIVIGFIEIGGNERWAFIIAEIQPLDDLNKRSTT